MHLLAFKVSLTNRPKGIRYFTAYFKVGIPDLRLSGVTNGNIWGVQDKDTRHIDNIIYLPRELLGRYVSRRTFLQKEAGADGYILRFISACNYALRCYNSCHLHDTQKVAPLLW